MKKEQIVEKAGGFLARASFQFKKHSPEIFVVAGIVGTVASAVMACRATLRVSSVFDEAKNDIERIHKNEKDGDMQDNTQKNIVAVYARTGLKIVRLYAPSVVLGALSITSIVTSHGMMKKRNLALASAYTAIDKNFKGYRDRIAERFGDEVEKEIRYNLKDEKIEETVVDPETGKEKKVKKTVKVVSGDLSQYSEYARYFDETSTKYNRVEDLNMSFLSGAQNFLNTKLRANKYVFLDEVYDFLDLPKTKASRAVGWVYDPYDPNCDSYIDLRTRIVYRKNEEGIIKPVIMLDPNVDGDILDKFEEIEMR